MDKLIKFFTDYWTYGAYALVAGIIFAAGVQTEHLLEAGKRSDLQAAIITLQADIKAIRDERDSAFRNLRDAENRLAENQEVAIDEYETDNAEIDTLIASAIAEFEANASPDCRATASDVERMRNLIQSLEAVRNN